MNVQSICLRTDLMIARFSAEVLDRGDHIIIHTPSNPTYHWGNFVIFAEPPKASDFERWMGIFDDFFGNNERIKHRAFSWDNPHNKPAELQLFLDWGLELDESDGLSTSELTRPKWYNNDIEIRVITHQKQWSEVLELQVACREPAYSEANYRQFRTELNESYRRLEQEGRGHWYGAYLDGQLVADLGLYSDGKLGRYQAVETHSDYRRRGICQTLIYEVGQHFLTQSRAQELAIIADWEAPASRLYRSLGFKHSERSEGLYWRPQD